MACKLIVRNRDKVPPGHPNHHTFFQEGDVIEVVPDGWSIGRLDLINPDYTIIECDMEPEEARQQFMAPEPGDPLVNPNLRRRATRIDKTRVPVALRNMMNSNIVIDRMAGNREKTYTEVENDFMSVKGFIAANRLDLLSYRTVKEAVSNPFVIGRNPFDIK